MTKMYKSQSQKIFDSLEEGIVVITDGSISFMNNLFKRVLEPFKRQNKEIENIKLFMCNSGSEESFSLADLIKKGESEIEHTYKMLSDGEFFR